MTTNTFQRRVTPLNKIDLERLDVDNSMDIPYQTNPLTRPYISVCKSSRCNNGRDWQSVYDAIAVELSFILVTIAIANILGIHE